MFDCTEKKLCYIFHENWRKGFQWSIAFASQMQNFAVTFFRIFFGVLDLKTQCLWKSKYWVMDGTTFELWTVWNSLHPCCYLCRLLEHLCRMLCNFQKNQIFTVTQHNQGFALAEWHLIFSLTIFFTEMQKSIYLPFPFTGWLKLCTLLWKLQGAWLKHLTL